MTDDLPLFAVTHSRKHGEPTSYEAAKSMAEEAANQRQAILDVLNSWGPHTADELDRFLDWRPTSAGRRLPDMVTDGLVEWTGEKRLTRSGRRANVYRATNKKASAA